MLLKRRFGGLGLLAMVGCNVQAGPVTQIQSWGAMTAPATLIYGNSFNDPDPTTAGVQINPAGLAITLQARDEFHDHYLFSVGPVVASFVTLTIDLGNVFDIDGLVVELYDATGVTASVAGSPSQLAAMTPLVRSSAMPGNGPGELQAIDSVVLGRGAYLLDIHGFVTGASGGSYSGVINLSALAVPEPGGASLALCALAAATLATWRPESKRIANTPCAAATRVMTAQQTSERVGVATSA